MTENEHVLSVGGSFKRGHLSELQEDKVVRERERESNKATQTQWHTLDTGREMRQTLETGSPAS